MAQAQIDMVNQFSVDDLRAIILQHSTDAERFKELYQQRVAIRRDLQQSLEEIKKFKRVLRTKLALECKTKRESLLPTAASASSAGPVGENRKKRSLEKAFGNSEIEEKEPLNPIDFSKYKFNKKSKKMQIPDTSLSCEDAKKLSDEKVFNPKNEGFGYFLITRNNFKVFSPTYPTIEEFGYIHSIEPATKEALESTYYTTLQDFLKLYTPEGVTRVDIKPVVECLKPKSTVVSEHISIKSTEKDSELFSDTDTDDE